jgi:hypothetical protein
MQAEITKLKAEFRRTTDERVMLKKASAFFAKVSEWSTRLSKSIAASSDWAACAGFWRCNVVAHAWLKEPQSPRALENAKLSEQIRYYCDQSIGIYGSPRIYHDLREAGVAPAWAGEVTAGLMQLLNPSLAV